MARERYTGVGGFRAIDPGMHTNARDFLQEIFTKGTAGGRGGMVSYQQPSRYILPSYTRTLATDYKKKTQPSQQKASKKYQWIFFWGHTNIRWGYDENDYGHWYIKTAGDGGGAQNRQNKKKQPMNDRGKGVGPANQIRKKRYRRGKILSNKEIIPHHNTGAS